MVYSYTAALTRDAVSNVVLLMDVRLKHKQIRECAESGLLFKEAIFTNHR